MAGGQQLHGSQRWLQVAVNRGAEIIDGAMADAAGLAPSETVRWDSPLESDGFREYRDQEFLDRLKVRPAFRGLSDFWPHGGPRWDALGRTSGGRRLLVEAKANIREFNSDPSRAGSASLTKIRAALAETKDFLGVRSETDWTRCFYQYANRIAHLYLLRELNGVDAVLVFVYFLGDTTVSGREPVSREGWESDKPGPRAPGPSFLLAVASQQCIRCVRRRE